jgi:hypothetical protein
MPRAFTRPLLVVLAARIRALPFDSASYGGMYGERLKNVAAHSPKRSGGRADPLCERRTDVVSTAELDVVYRDVERSSSSSLPQGSWLPI